MSGTRKVPLIICLLLAFTSLGVSLDCVTCSNIGQHCTGPTATCSVEENTCATIAIRGLKNLQINANYVTKSCLTPSICNLGIPTLDFGKSGFQRTVISCCAENECNKKELKVPERNTTVNGKRCPACYGLQCVEEIIECIGDEVHCFEMTTKVSTETFKTSFILKGCANDGGCTSLKEGERMLDAMREFIQPGVSHTVRCAGVALSNSISEFWGLLLLCLIELLLVRHLD